MSDSGASRPPSNDDSSGTEHDSNSSGVSHGYHTPPSPANFSQAPVKLRFKDDLLERLALSNRRKRDRVDELSTRLHTEREQREQVQAAAKELVGITKKALEENSKLVDELGQRRRSGSRDARSKSTDRDRGWSRDRSPSSRARHFDNGQRYRGRSPPRRRSRSSGGPRGRPESGDGRKLARLERRDVMPSTPRYSPPRAARHSDLSPEERDARSVFVVQLPQRIAPRDLEIFFSSVGEVRDVRIVTETTTDGSEGIGYIEFWDQASVPLALGSNGRRLLGVPIMVQPVQSEMNRMDPAMQATSFQQNRGPFKLYVGSLHFNITEDALRGIFEPFGKIDQIEVSRDPETNRSSGYGFITFHSKEDAKRAMEQLNGFELDGRPMDVGEVVDHQRSASMDSEEVDRTDIVLWTTGRLQLVDTSAESAGEIRFPSSAQHILNIRHQLADQSEQPTTSIATPPITTHCFMLSNMFDAAQEIGDKEIKKIEEYVNDECKKHGSIVHMFVDKESPEGNVYIKCSSVTAACSSVNAFHGRCYLGRIITANYVQLSRYQLLFPDTSHNQHFS